MSSYPCPENWASQLKLLSDPQKTIRDVDGGFGLRPAPGRFSGHEPKLLPWTSSDREMSLTPWPPVWLPEMPVNRRSMRRRALAGRPGNLFR